MHACSEAKIACAKPEVGGVMGVRRMGRRLIAVRLGSPLLLCDFEINLASCTSKFSVGKECYGN